MEDILEIREGLNLTLHEVNGDTKSVLFRVSEVFNFGYAGRNQRAIQEHVDELVALGLPAPTTVPALFLLPPQQTTTATELVVAGSDTYGEVEYALMLSEIGWLVTVASDHSDFAVERLSTARSKAVCPDVLSPECWRLDDLLSQWDQLDLKCSRTDNQGEKEVQHGSLSELLPPADLLIILERRLGRKPSVGSVVLSGTLSGEPLPGALSWSVSMSDPATGRILEHKYQVRALADELAEPK
ncbi:unannotated protein [freshwater metagenome]|uniref:Unannotated protein n=1 Tax=freshwater metagenome TaxID=449393 RepID=A0A6J7EQ05_9ZZZZ|nr:DUF2848 domain-containing protein [Actinomycetota bacterium]MSX70029.1 DUF2848 domain-containing protein [Actinomycetota bacterium]